MCTSLVVFTPFIYPPGVHSPKNASQNVQLKIYFPKIHFGADFGAPARPFPNGRGKSMAQERIAFWKISSYSVLQGVYAKLQGLTPYSSRR